IAYSHLIVPRTRMVLDFEEAADDWTVQRIELQMANPAHDAPEPQQLEAWRADPLRAPLMGGLYG
ncbi:hypothetical protein RZS08_25550, partial [Arthrospira platensis SPKY1]|nr:hypothetical protein [Arthrospira platensis SPKY1]